MKVFLILLLGTFACLSSTSFENIELESEIALLINTDNNAILYEKNADIRVAPASITKIATTLYAIKEVSQDLDVEIVADQDCVGTLSKSMAKNMDYKYPAHWIVTGGQHLQISKGDSLSLEELLYGTLLFSANDAANMIAKYVSGTIPQFMIELNEYLEKLGCQNTHFENPHGIYVPRHLTTAYDMAIIAQEALKYPLFRKIVATPSYDRPSKKGEPSQCIMNSNLLIRKQGPYSYAYATGLKDGFLDEAKYTLVASAEKDGRRLIAVVMQSPDKHSRYRDTKLLFETAFNEQKVSELYLKKGPQKFKQKILGFKKVLKTYLKEDIYLDSFPSEKPKLSGVITWNPPLEQIKKGNVVAELTLKDSHSQVLSQVDLYAQNSLSNKSYKGFWIIFIGGLIGITYSVIRKKKDSDKAQ